MRKRLRFATIELALVLFLMSQCCFGLQSQNADLTGKIQNYKSQHALETIQRLREFIELPNVSSNRQEVRRVANWIVDQFERRGVKTQLLEVPAANPVVYGEISVADAKRTVCIYAHFDGQPVNPSRWTATKPFEPALYSRAITDGGRRLGWPESGETFDPEWRIYGRAASDDKAPFVALIAALDAMKEFDIQPTSNIKFFFDGEEEIGSPNMQRVLIENKGKFRDVDLWIFCDGPLHQSRQPTMYYGVRGITSLDLTVYGANRNLHSGHYGNWAPNPGMVLARLLASMKDDEGQVLISGFYDSTIPLTPAEQAAMDGVPSVDDQLREELGLAQTENKNQPYIERMQLPSLNVRGMQSASVGKTARNIVPNTASASIDIRLVKGNRPNEMLDLVEKHIEQQGFFVTTQPPTAAERRSHARIVQMTRKEFGYPAARTSMDAPQVKPLARQLTRFLRSDETLLQIPSLGGSLPLYLITEGEKKPLVILPLANHDNNQHAPDENLRLGNLWYGIDAMMSILTMPEN